VWGRMERENIYLILSRQHISFEDGNQQDTGSIFDLKVRRQ
jgi:hypothetical protein